MHRWTLLRSSFWLNAGSSRLNVLCCHGDTSLGLARYEGGCNPYRMVIDPITFRSNFP